MGPLKKKKKSTEAVLYCVILEVNCHMLKCSLIFA